MRWLYTANYHSVVLKFGLRARDHRGFKSSEAQLEGDAPVDHDVILVSSIYYDGGATLSILEVPS